MEFLHSGKFPSHIYSTKERELTSKQYSTTLPSNEESCLQYTACEANVQSPRIWRDRHWSDDDRLPLVQQPDYQSRTKPSDEMSRESVVSLRSAERHVSWGDCEKYTASSVTLAEQLSETVPSEYSASLQCVALKSSSGNTAKNSKPVSGGCTPSSERLTVFRGVKEKLSSSTSMVGQTFARGKGAWSKSFKPIRRWMGNNSAASADILTPTDVKCPPSDFLRAPSDHGQDQYSVGRYVFTSFQGSCPEPPQHAANREVSDAEGSKKHQQKHDTLDVPTECSGESSSEALGFSFSSDDEHDFQLQSGASKYKLCTERTASLLQ